VVLSLPGQTEDIVARLGRDTTLRYGNEARVVLDAAEMHLFDPKSGAGLSGRSGSGRGSLK
jgi:hypothetical protein